MKKLILSTAILFALAGTSQAQFSTGNLLNKAKDKAKQKADEKTKQEAEKAFSKGNKKEDKNNPTDNPSKNETMTEEQTETTSSKDYANMNKEAYIQALNLKSNRAMSIDHLQGTGKIDIDEYYDRAVIIDLANFYPVMLKKGKPTGYEGLNEYDRLMEVHKTYPATYEANFKPLINGTIDGAYQLMKTNRADAVANLQLAMKMNDACLMVIPDLKSALEMKAELEGAITKIGGEQAKVYTSDFHKKNAGKVLFSKTPIVPGKENAAQFTTSFAPGDPIYAMAYLNGTIKELTNSNNGELAQGRYILKIDGTDEFVYTLEFNHNKEDYKKACFPIEVRPEPAAAVHGLDATYFAERFSNLSPRKHTIGISFTSPGNYNDAFAYGEIKIDWTNGDAAKMTADAKAAVAKAQTNYAKTVNLDDYFYKPNYVFQDPALSVANLKKAFLAGTPDAVQVLKLITIKERASDDWTIQRNEYGVIVSKNTNHYTSFVYKAKDGNCYIHEMGSFFRAATGGGSYGNLVLNPTGMIDKRIACENVR